MGQAVQAVEEPTHRFIEALRFPLDKACQSQISLVLHPEDFIQHWKHAKEQTSSSPSGLHFGHYKSAATSPMLAHLHAHFTQLIFMTGLSISRYQAGLQVILEKKAGNIHVDNLRAILLMEGDFNAAMKIFIGACLVQNALSLQLIPDECFGSQPGCTAIQVSLDRTLTADVTRQSWATLAVASVDCLTCYDSIGHPPASITCQQLGAPISPRNSFLKYPEDVHLPPHRLRRFHIRLWRFNFLQAPVSRRLPRQQGRPGNLACHQHSFARDTPTTRPCFEVLLPSQQSTDDTHWYDLH